MEPSLQQPQAPFIHDPRFPGTLRCSRGVSNAPSALGMGKETQGMDKTQAKPPRAAGDRSLSCAGWEPPKAFPSRGKLLPAAPQAGADLCCWDHPWDLGHLHTHRTPAWSPAGGDTSQGRTSPISPVPPSTNDPKHPLSTPNTLSSPRLPQPSSVGQERSRRHTVGFYSPAPSLQG